MHINCSDSNFNSEILELAHNLYEFMRNEFGFECEPKVHFVSNLKNAENILGRTGHYDPDKEEITVYITNRHGKDILRSFAHELLHHIQGCEGMMDKRDMSATSDPNYIMHDKYLKFLEADAFKRGNICFRKWEATIKDSLLMTESKNLEEKKKLPKRKLKLAHKKAKKALKMGGFEKYGPDAEKVAYATMTKQAKKKLEEKESKNKKVKGIPFNQSGLKHPEKADTKPPDGKLQPWEIAVAKKIEASQEEKEEKKEVKVNEALTNSHYYIPSDRGAPEAYAAREEKIYNELLRKFKIKK